MLERLCALAIDAGLAIRAIAATSFDQPAKSDGSPVTKADLAADRIIVEGLAKIAPQVPVVSEESADFSKAPGDLFFLVDPLDGTTNFVMGVPYFATSIALARDGAVVVGVVFNPVTGDLYTARKGAGALLNGAPVEVDASASLAAALLGSSYGADEGHMADGIRVLKALSSSVRKVAVRFSPALDLCNIARGRMHGYVDNGTTPEDHAAAALILAEAGGTVQDYGATDWDIRRPGVIAASNKVLADTLQQIVRDATS